MKQEIVGTPQKVMGIKLGYSNKRLPECLQENILSYGVNKKTYDFYISGDKESARKHYLTLKSGVSGELISPAVATRRLNILESIIFANPDTLWINLSGDTLYWGQAQGEHFIVDEYIEDNPNPIEVRGHYLLAKKMVTGWSNLTYQGYPIRLSEAHPQLFDWVNIQQTIGELHKGGDYLLKYIRGDIKPAHSESIRHKSLLDASIDRMIDSAYQVAKYSNGQQKIVVVKNKDNKHDRDEWRALLAEMLEKKGARCALTNREFDFSGVDRFLMPSLDRIDSNGHYEKGNVQIVTWAANRAKGALRNERCDEYFAALQIASQG